MCCAGEGIKTDVKKVIAAIGTVHEVIEDDPLYNLKKQEVRKMGLNYAVPGLEMSILCCCFWPVAHTHHKDKLDCTVVLEGSRESFAADVEQRR